MPVAIEAHERVRGVLDQGAQRTEILLVARAGIHQSGVSRHLRILQAAGFVSVRPDKQRRLYSLGWLTQPWQDMVDAAAERLREEPEMLFRMPGVGTQSGLDQWSRAVASGRVQPTGANIPSEQACESLLPLQ